MKICPIHRGRSNPHAVGNVPERAQVLDLVAK